MTFFMRNEEQVLKQALDFASADDRVRAVILNGSRVNQNAPKDFMRDYDVVFFVNDIEDMSFKRDRSWIAQFGELVMLQQNNFDDGSYIFLMQFDDSVRIDLYFYDINKVNAKAKEDSLSIVLLDKDNVINQLPEPNESTYFITKPSMEKWDATLNELWWLQIYIAKELWREELPLVKELYDVYFIDSLRALVEWSIGYKHNWQINVGKCGKWFKYFLDKDLYEEYISFYTGADYAEIWDRLLKVGSFIRKIGIELADKLGYEYPMQYDINVSQYIRRVRQLPKDVQSMEN